MYNEINEYKCDFSNKQSIDELVQKIVNLVIEIKNKIIHGVLML